MDNYEYVTNIYGHDVGGGRWSVYWAAVRKLSGPNKKGKCTYEAIKFETLTDGRPSQGSLDTKIFLSNQTGKSMTRGQRIVNLAHAEKEANRFVNLRKNQYDGEFIYFHRELHCIEEVNDFLNKYGEE